jgi:hypothetical protein
MRKLPGQFSLACLLILYLHPPAAAQEPKTPGQDLPGQSEQTVAAARTKAEETFELNITERRITKSNYAASTSVEIDSRSARGVSLRVGVAVSAAQIDVLMRGVAGHVRFKASLEPLLARIRGHSAQGAPR